MFDWKHILKHLENNYMVILAMSQFNDYSFLLFLFGVSRVYLLMKIKHYKILLELE